MQTESIQLHDDGQVPNNPACPLVIYHDVFSARATASDAIALFNTNSWSGAWINGIYDFHHYHARAHEVLANLGAKVTVQFGGADGPIIDFQPGAVVVIPAGGGHCRLSSGDGLKIIGAYPSGQEDWDLKRADNPQDYIAAKSEIANVSLPSHDPVFGHDGPLLRAWNVRA